MCVSVCVCVLPVPQYMECVGEGVCTVSMSTFCNHIYSHKHAGDFAVHELSDIAVFNHSSCHLPTYIPNKHFEGQLSL